MTTKNVVRIISGKWGGRRISFPDKHGLRPTGDRARETLFNWLQGDIEGSSVLDLFAGSGALGIEALSRGARHATFVERDKSAVHSIKDTLNTLTVGTEARVFAMDAGKFLRAHPLDGAGAPYDLIFLDPPFGKGLIESTLPFLLSSPCLAPGGLIYIECEVDHKLELSPEWQNVRQKSQGMTQYGLWQLA